VNGPSDDKEYLYALDFAKKTQRIFPLRVAGAPTSFHLSPSTSMLVLTVQPRTVIGQPKVRAASTVDVWVLWLQSEKQIKLLSFSDTDTSTKAGG
jgi:hypothetical protein